MSRLLERNNQNLTKDFQKHRIIADNIESRLTEQKNSQIYRNFAKQNAIGEKDFVNPEWSMVNRGFQTERKDEKS